VSRGLGGDQVEGRLATRELLLAGRRRVAEVVVAEQEDQADELLREIVDLALELKVTVREVGRARLQREARTEAPQGIIARAAPLAETDLDDLVAGRTGRMGRGRSAAPFIVAVDGVTDPTGLGLVIRAAEAAGVTGMVLPRHRAVHITPTVTKAAAGAIEHVPMALVGGIPTALGQLRSAGVWILGLDPTAERPVFASTVDAAGPVALVIGAEQRGLARLTRQRCDELAGLPNLGELGSVDAATAATVACFDIARRRLAG
jgi:23S rRNA (guanosine2251-2'-O)-methyltransferase